MAQKYLMALEYSDLHANTVLKKHAQRRTLGDIETRHRYTPTQPVLSCRTVDIDVSGTRTYRPKSSADIISEQHAIIHKIYNKRNVASAPPKRSKTPRRPKEVKNNKNYENKLKSVEVQGRPLTSLSQRPPDSPGRASKASRQRPQTTDGIKKDNKVSKENFMLVRADRELFETKKSYRSITKKIHRQWQPENHDLNTGTFQRGKKPPGVPTIDSWLSFSGSQADEADGIVDAFADIDRQGEYYNIEGGVGTRIAQQLQGGNKIRVGINGSVQTDELKVRKWNKESSFVGLDLDDYRKENMANTGNIIPLSWDDQVQSTEAKVMTPRGPPPDQPTLNLSETRPVVFTKLLPGDSHSNLSSAKGKKKEGFRVRQRTKAKPCVDGKEREANKVTVVTIDAKGEEEERKLENLTIDDVIEQTCKHIDKQNGRFGDDNEKLSVTFSTVESNGQHVLQNNAYNQSKVSVSDSISSGGSDFAKHPKVKPSQPTFSSKYQEVDLDIIGTLSVPNGTRPLSNESDQYAQQGLYTNTKSPLPNRHGQVRMNSARSTRSSMKSAKSGQQKSMGSVSMTSMGPSSYKQNEAEFIQISHPMKAPPTQHAMPQKKSDFIMSPGMNHEAMRGQTRVYSGTREPVPSPEFDNYDGPTEQVTPPSSPTATQNPTMKPITPALSISIPTADYTDSALNSPSQRHMPDLETSPLMKRARNMRDEQIDQITTLLEDAIIAPEEIGVEQGK